jgi:hypothetical protein
MRLVGPLALAALSCGGSPGDGATRGPIERTVHVADDAVRVRAVRHRLDLATLPTEDWFALPARGTVVVDARVVVPIDHGRRDLRRARGHIGLRCDGPCQVGDDVARLAAAGAAAIAPDGIAFGHLSLDGLDVELTIADGHARVTRFALASPDLELSVELDASLDRGLDAARLRGCVRFRATEALRARDPRLHGLLALLGSQVDDRGRASLAIDGTFGAPRVAPRPCPAAGADDHGAAPVR